MVRTNTEAHSALSKAVHQAHEGLTEHLKFAAAIETFQQQILRDLESSSDESRSYFAKAVKSMESVTLEVINRLSNIVKSTENDFTDLDNVSPVKNTQSITNHRQKIHKSNDEIMDLQRNIGRLFQQAVSGNAELAASQTKQWQTSQDLATRLERSLKSLRETELRGLLSALNIMHTELVSQLTLTFGQHGTDSNSNCRTTWCPGHTKGRIRWMR